MDFGSKRAPLQRRRLDRRNALRDVDYEPGANAGEDDGDQDDQPPPSSSRSWSSADGVLRFWFGQRSHSPSSSGSAKLYASKTSFRIDGEFDNEVDVICRNLGLSGPEDFAIPTSMWEASRGMGGKSQSSTPESGLSGGRARMVTGLNEQDRQHGGKDRDGRREEDVTQDSPSPLNSPPYSTVHGPAAGNSTSSSSPQVPKSTSIGNGIKGSRPAALCPPSPAVSLPVLNKMESNNTVVMDLVPSAPPGEHIDTSNNSYRSVIREKEAVEKANEEDTERSDAVVTISRELSRKCSVAEPERNNVGSGSSRRGREGVISSSRRVRRNITGWMQGCELGRGTFGTVYEAISDDGFFFALKEVSLLDQGANAQQCVEQLEHEIILLSNFEHENIVQYLGTKKGEAKLYIFLELATHGSLASLYQKYQLQDSQVSSYTRQILHGLQYLHERNIVHRDIKCSNILVDASGSVKLADFGLAKETTKYDMLKSCKGSVYWMAPEVVNPRCTYGPAADIWSLGCTVLEMLTRKLPYPDMEWVQVLYGIGKGQTPVIPDSLSADARDFISKCLKVVPEDRPTASMLLEHPFVERQLLNSRNSGSDSSSAISK